MRKELIKVILLFMEIKLNIDYITVFLKLRIVFNFSELLVNKFLISNYIIFCYDYLLNIILICWRTEFLSGLYCGLYLVVF